jgi:penicillin-binding protein 1A
MTPDSNWKQRLTLLGERLRTRTDEPFLVWARRRWRSLTALGVGVVLVVAFDAWLYTCGFDSCPTPERIQQFRPTEGSRVYSRDGELLGRLTYVRRVNVPLARVPRHVRQAFLATEDRRFYDHNGLDWRAVVRAAARNTASLGIREGFSTITMQVARNSFTPRRAQERTIRRKLIELRLARLIERTLTKDQILELYLNIIYLGNGTYGVEAASRDLFGKGVRQLSVAEAAMLAALPKGPSAYTPRRHPERARTRRNLVLSLMQREGYLTPERARAAARQPLRIASREWRPAGGHSYALDAIRTVVDSVLGEGTLDEMDVKVYSTIDLAAQRAAERAVANRAAVIQRATRNWYGSVKDEVQGAMVALDPRTGDLRAVVGGRRYERGTFNRAVAARRQPGSAFKPFVYAAALAAGFTPASLVDDTPVEIEQNGRVWTPANYGDDYGGRITFRRALMRSANAAAVRVSRAIGEERVVAVAKQSGITSPLEPLPSIALGALEVTPLELVTAYAPFANGGARVRPRLVTRIESLDGTLLWSQPVATPAQVLDPRDAFQLTSMLESVVDRGTGRVIRDMGARGLIAGKTGTTNNGADVWFVGYTPTLVAGFWFGYDTPRSLAGNAAGGSMAAPAWADFYMRGWREDAPSGAWDPPGGMVMRLIDPETGHLAGEWCPIVQREWFKPGTEPTDYCDEHLEPDWDWIDNFGNRISSTIKRIFRF